MTLGLARSDGVAIHLVTESYTSKPIPSEWRLTRKVIRLQEYPPIGLLVAGGLQHWNDAIVKLGSEKSASACATALCGLLDSCMNQSNQAFGLVCGFEDGIAVCYRVDRFLHVATATVSRETLDVTRGLGCSGNRFAEIAEAKIQLGESVRDALEQTVGEAIAAGNLPLQSPIEQIETR